MPVKKWRNRLDEKLLPAEVEQFKMAFVDWLIVKKANPEDTKINKETVQVICQRMAHRNPSWADFDTVDDIYKTTLISNVTQTLRNMVLDRAPKT